MTPRAGSTRSSATEQGVEVALVDAGILAEPLVGPDITRREVAAAAGADVERRGAARDRAAAIEAMGRGAAAVVLRLHAEGRLDAIGALGGTGGTALATHAMRALPVGVPKLMVSTVASGDTSTYVATTDVTMMPSVVDVTGLNRVSSRILANAGRALAGMAAGSEHAHGGEKPLVVASMWVSRPRASRPPASGWKRWGTTCSSSIRQASAAGRWRS